MTGFAGPTVLGCEEPLATVRNSATIRALWRAKAQGLLARGLQNNKKFGILCELTDVRLVVPILLLL